MGLSPLMLDVRPDLAKGQDPFATIMQAVGRLRAGQELLLIAPFEPVPLYTVLEHQGFAHQAEHLAPNEWRVTFHPVPAAPPDGATCQQQASAACLMAPSGADANPGQHTIHLDTRGMEPPGPLLLILKTLETLGADQHLVAQIDREPLLLFPELMERGWSYEGAPQPDGSYIIRIQRPQ